MAKKKREPAEVFWEGDSLDVVREFPEDIRKKLGEDIRRLQLGEAPNDAKPMRSIGPRVAELRQRDQDGWYRSIYLGVVDGKLHMLHSFVKKSRKTPQNDLDVAKARLKVVKQRIAEEKKRKSKNAKRKK